MRTEPGATMTWHTPLLSYRCGACGTQVTGLMSYTYVVDVEKAHAKVCKGFPPDDDAEIERLRGALREIRMLTVEVGDSVEAATRASVIALEALGD